MSNVWYLKGLEGQYAGAEIKLPGEVLWLGRAVSGTPNSDTHMFFEDGAVSRVHGALAWNEKYSAYVIHHRSQTNPTFLNGETLSQPKLLKAGDVISLGHQKLEVVEVQSSLNPSLPSPLPISETVEICLKAKTKSGSVVLTASEQIVIELDPSFPPTTSPEQLGSSTCLKVPARKPAKLTVTSTDQPGHYQVTVECPDIIQTHRVTSSGQLILDVPYAGNSSFSFGTGDQVVHQGLELSSWSSGDTEPDESTASSTVSIQSGGFKKPLSEDPDRGTVEFQTGPWKGATITLGPSYSQGIEIGPNCSISGVPVPIKDGPTCRICFFDNAPHIELVEAVEGQYVSVNGELLFATQANPLVSGSGILLGKTMLFWTQPAIQKRLSEYKVVVGDLSLPIPRAVARLGSAAHCELVFEGNGLAPVTGSLLCTHEGFCYKHQDGSVPAQVDGETLISGDRAAIKDGSVIQIGFDTIITLKAK